MARSSYFSNSIIKRQDEERKSEGLSGFFQKVINWFRGTNEPRRYSDTDSQELPSTWDSLVNRYTGNGLTGAEIQANAIAAREAQKQRDWEENLANTGYQRGVVDMQAAGLNPALMYGSGSAAPTPSGASASPVSPSSMGFQDLISLMQLPLQLKNISANIQKTKEETESEKVRRSQIQQSIEESKAKVNNLMANTDLTDTQQANLVVIGSYLDRMQEANLNYINSQSALNKSTKKRIDELLFGEKRIQNLTIEDFKHRWDLMQKEAEKLSAETGLLQSDIENYMLNHMSNGWLGTGLSMQNVFRAILSNYNGDNKW